MQHGRTKHRFIALLFIICYLLFAITACPQDGNGDPGFLAVDSLPNITLYRGQFRVFTAMRGAQILTDAAWTVRGTSAELNAATGIDANGLLFIAYGELNTLLEVQVDDPQGESLTINVQVPPANAQIYLPEASIFPWQGRFTIAPGTGTSLAADFFSEPGLPIAWEWTALGDPPGISIESGWLELSPDLPTGNSFMIRALDPNNADRFGYATLTIGEPLVTGVRLAGDTLIRGEENTLFAQRDMTGPSSSLPEWTWAIESPVHANTRLIDGQPALFVADNETAETIRVRVTLAGTGFFDEQELAVEVPTGSGNLISIDPAGPITAARGTAVLLTAIVEPDVAYDSIEWIVQAGGWWGFPHENTVFSPADPFSVYLNIAADETQQTLIVTASLLGGPVFGIFAPYAEVTINLSP